MRWAFTLALVFAGCLTAASRLHAQAPAGGSAPQSQQNKPAADGQKPASPSSSNSNPFPEDTTSVPVIPTTAVPDIPTEDGDTARAPLPGDDRDPVRTPDDSANAANGSDSGSSSSLANIDSLLPGADIEESGRKSKKSGHLQPEHQETAAEDESVGNYYLGGKNWKAALSRFQSALVLDPDNPDVYWGLAESQRHLGHFADARANYQKVMEYDPDSHHAKEAVKVLKEPDLANAKAAPPNQPQSSSPQ